MHQRLAEQLADLYEAPFGGKERGRFRVPMKLMCQIADRRRLYEEDVKEISRALFELGYTLVDMETYFCVLRQRTFASYRRVNAEQLGLKEETASKTARKQQRVLQ
ncbi:MAG: hypothetical protein ACRBCJ_03365 [Hyphomicrobiaceae bacterium]